MRETLRTTFELLAALGYGLIQAALVFLISVLLSRAIRRLIRRQLRSTLAPENVKHLVENIATFAILGFGATILLTHWGVTWTTLVTAVGLSTLAVALGLQSVLQSLVGGTFVLFERPYSIGDRIRFSVHRVGGTVENIAWRTTVVRDDEGARIVVPNSLALTNAIINSSPERAVLTIVTVHGAGGERRTLQESLELAKATLADMHWPETRPEITIHSALHRLRLPRLVCRIPRIGPGLDRMIRHVVDETIQIRVAWTGVNDPAILEDVRQRLHSQFESSEITTRRW